MPGARLSQPGLRGQGDRWKSGDQRLDRPRSPEEYFRETRSPFADRGGGEISAEVASPPDSLKTRSGARTPRPRESQPLPTRGQGVRAPFRQGLGFPLNWLLRAEKPALQSQRHWMQRRIKLRNGDRPRRAANKRPLTVTSRHSPRVGALLASCRPGWSLPREFYSEEEIYRLDLERIWRRGWLFAGH